MPRPGGESDKLGNRYEAMWTIGRLLDLATGECASLTVEPFGSDSLGIEFIVTATMGDATSIRSSGSIQRNGRWPP